MSKLRTDQLETLDGLNTKNVATLVDDINAAQVTTSTGEQTLAEALDNRATISNSIVIRVPSDKADLQSALNEAGRLTLPIGESIEILIESGYEIPAGVELRNKDLKGVVISSEDDEVFLASGFAGVGVTTPSTLQNCLFGLVNCTGLSVNCLFNGSQTAVDSDSTGANLTRGSYLFVTDGSGFKNFDGFGLYIDTSSSASASGGVFTNNGRGSNVTLNSSINAQNADFSVTTKSGESCLYVARSSIANVMFSDFSNSAYMGLHVRRSFASADNATADNCADSGFFAEMNAALNCPGSSAQNCTVNGYLCDSSTMRGRLGNASGSGRGVVVLRASTFNFESGIANNCTTNVALIQGPANVNLRGVSGTGCGGTALDAIGAASVDCENSDFSGASGQHGIAARDLANISARNANAQKGASPDSNDIRVFRGGIISAHGAIGGTFQTVNSLTSSGIIFQ